MKWFAHTIGELVDLGVADIQTGPFGTQLKASDYVEKGTPVINVRNIGMGKLKQDKLEYVPDSITQRLSVHLLKKGDIVFGRKGAVERHLFVKEEHENWMQGSDCIRLRLSTDKIDPQFVSYVFLTTAHMTWMITQSGNKATMPSLNQDIIRRIKISAPTIDIQRKIVSTLSSYDELIENNDRRITLLEKAARLLYEEWFVRLWFPGHEHTKVVNGMPEGWSIVRMEDVCDSVGGGTPSTKNPEFWKDGRIPWVTPTDITKNGCLVLLDSEKKITESGLKNSSAKKLPPEAILMTSRATIGYFALCEHEVTTNQGFISIIPKAAFFKMYLLFNLLGRREELLLKASGTTYLEINKSTFREMDILFPNQTLLENFNDIAYGYIKQIRCLKKQNQKLKQARDLLLPKLMSGEVLV